MLDDHDRRALRVAHSIPEQLLGSRCHAFVRNPGTAINEVIEPGGERAFELNAAIAALISELVPYAINPEHSNYETSDTQR